MWPMFAVITVVMLAVYERVARRPANPWHLHGSASVAAFSVAAFDIGMVGWMLLLHFIDLMPPVTESTFVRQGLGQTSCVCKF